MKKLLALFLCIVMICSCIPTSVFAEGGDTAIIDSETVEESQEPTESIEEPVADISAVEEPTVEAAPRKAETPALTEEEVIALAEQSWDVSAAQDGSIHAYAIPNNDDADSLSVYVFGCGRMMDYDWDENTSPLHDSDAVTAIAFENGIENIGATFLAGASSLTDVYIADSVTEIGDYAFDWCGNLDNVVLSENIASLGDSSFEGCGLTHIEIPSSVENFGPYVFTDCYSLESATLPDNMTAIPLGLFCNCERLQTIDIPSTVIEIQAGAFAFCALSSIVLPEGLISIGSFAFQGNPVEEILLPQSLQTIDDYAFSESSLTSVVIPENVRSIGTESFSYTQIETITIPKSVEYWGENPFAWCRNLTEIIADEESTIFSSVNGVLFNKNKTKIISYPCGLTGEYVVPETVTTIGTNAFIGCSNLSAISFPSGLKTIEDNAFSSCRGLTTIVLPEGLQTIGSDAFLETSNVTSVTIPSSLENWGTYAFAYCQKLSSIKLTDGLTTVGKAAFCNCNNLESVYIPQSVENVEANSFIYCSKLSSAFFYGDMPAFGTNAFAYCASNLRLKYLSGKLRWENCPYRTIQLNTIVEAYYDDATATLTISGVGAVSSSITDQYRDKVKNVIIKDGITDISAMTFLNFSLLESVTLPDSLTNIGGSAFYDCSSLTSVTIPDSVTSIDGCAFYNCANLTNITIPDSVTSIGSSAFEHCIGLTNIIIPDSVKIIDNGAFQYCYALENLQLGNGLKTIGVNAFYKCEKLTNLTIPRSVTSIGSNAFSAPTVTVTFEKLIASRSAFSECSSVSIIAGNETTIIPKTAFWRCYNLNSIVIPDTVTEIGESAFYGCTGLTSITIPDSVTTIGDSAFFNCTGLTSITIPDSVTSIGNHAFFNCCNLTSVVLSNNITEIGITTFQKCAGLTNVIIPDGVTKIGDHAFDNCTELTSVTIPDSVTSIGIYAFSGCSSLTSVTIPDSVTSIGNYAFWSCSSLTSMTIPDSVTSIGGSAFSGCSSLTSVTIPDSVTSIDSSAFYNCANLTNITIPDSVTSIRDDAFKGCSNIESITISENNQYFSCVDGILYNKEMTEVLYCPCSIDAKQIILPNSVTSIRSYAFANCKYVEEIIIPESVTDIGRSAFSGCESLSRITIPDSVTYLNVGTFSDCPALIEVNLPNSLTETGWASFSNCTALQTITLPESITTISGYSFQGCTNLSSVSMPENLESIDEFAFNSCTALKNVVVPDNVSHIGEGAFCSSGLETIDLPENLTTIDYEVFAASQLKSITIPNNVTEIRGDAFGGSPIVEIIVPSSVTSITEGAFVDCPELISVSILGNVNELPTSCFENCPKLESVIIPDSVTSIGDKCFYNCNSLENIALPNGITSIGTECFNGCSSLICIELPVELTDVGTGAFAKCSNLSNVTFGENITYISGYMFTECSSLKNVELPQNVTEILAYAFLDAGITSINLENIERIGSRAFIKSDLAGEITVPANCVVEGGAFFGCKNLEKVTWKQETYPVSNAYLHESGTFVYQGTEPWCASAATGSAINLALHLDNDADFYNNATIEVLGHSSHATYKYDYLFEHHNISYTEIDSSIPAILQALAEGKTIIIEGDVEWEGFGHVYAVFGVTEDGYIYVSDPSVSCTALTKYDPALLFNNPAYTPYVWAIDNVGDTNVIPEKKENNTKSSSAKNPVDKPTLSKESEWTAYSQGNAETKISFTYPAESSEPIDYIYVLDYSDSMTRLTVDAQYTNMSIEKTYALDSIDDLLNKNENARVSVVDFRGENEATFSAFTNNYEGLYDIIANAKCQGVTCYADGFEAALDAMNSRTGEDAERKTVVVFVSDGDEQWWINENDTSYIVYQEKYSHSSTGNANYGVEEATALREAGAEIYAVVLNPDISEAAEAKMTEITADESKVFVAGTIEEFGAAMTDVIEAEISRDFTITDTIGEDFNYNGNLTAAEGTTAVIDEANRTITWTLENILPNTEYTLSFDIQCKKDSSGQFVCGDLPTNLGNAVVKEGDIVVNEVETPVLHRDPVLVDDGAQAHMIHRYTDLKRADNPALYTDGIRFVMDLNMKELQDAYEPGDKLAFGIAMLPLDKLQNGQTTNYLTMNVGTAGQLSSNGSYTFVNNTSAISSSKKLTPANMITWTEAMENCTTPAAFAKLLKAAGMNIFDVTDTGIQYSVYMMFSNANTRQAQADREIAYRGIMVSYDAQNGYAVKYSFQRNNSATRIYNHYNCLNYNVINVKGATAADMLHGESEYNPSYEAQAAAQ